MHAIYFQSKPYLQLKKEPEDGIPLVGNKRYEGYCADLAEKISKILDIDYLIKLVADGKYGEKTEDGIWNGMVGELTKQVSFNYLKNCTQSSSWLHFDLLFRFFDSIFWSLWGPCLWNVETTKIHLEKNVKWLCSWQKSAIRGFWNPGSAQPAYPHLTDC